VVGEQAIEEEGVDDNEDERKSTGNAEGVGDGDALVDGVRILERDVGEGKVLVVGFDGVEDREADDTGTSEGQRGSERAVERVLVYSHQDHVVGDVAKGHRLVRHSAGERNKLTK
jgi:hypothetical protein